MAQSEPATRSCIWISVVRLLDFHDLRTLLVVSKAVSRIALAEMCMRPKFAHAAGFLQHLARLRHHDKGGVAGDASGPPAPLRILSITAELLPDLLVGDIVAMLELAPALERLTIESSLAITNLVVDRSAIHNPHLRYLSLRGCPITDSCVLDLVKGCARLADLDLSFTNCTLDTLFIAIHRATSLQRLVLSGIEGASSLPLPRSTQSKSSLRFLDVSSTPISDPLLNHVAAVCPRLRLLDLSNCGLISDGSLVDLPNRCSNLRHLFLTNLPRVTPATLNSLSASGVLGSLETLDLRGCSQLELYPEQLELGHAGSQPDMFAVPEAHESFVTSHKHSPVQSGAPSPQARMPKATPLQVSALIDDRSRTLKNQSQSTPLLRHYRDPLLVLKLPLADHALIPFRSDPSLLAPGPIANRGCAHELREQRAKARARPVMAEPGNPTIVSEQNRGTASKDTRSPTKPHVAEAVDLEPVSSPTNSQQAQTQSLSDGCTFGLRVLLAACLLATTSRLLLLFSLVVLGIVAFQILAPIIKSLAASVTEKLGHDSPVESLSPSPAVLPSSTPTPAGPIPRTPRMQARLRGSIHGLDSKLLERLPHFLKADASSTPIVKRLRSSSAQPQFRRPM